ncbi:hypothetical protein PG988_011902 [Apiospora saccharicola]
MEQNIGRVPKKRGRPRNQNRSPGPFPEKRARPGRPTKAEAALRQRVRDAYDANKEEAAAAGPSYDWEPPPEEESRNDASRAETRAAKRARRGEEVPDNAEDRELIQSSPFPALVPWCSVVDDDQLAETLKPIPATYRLLRDNGIEIPSSRLGLCQGSDWTDLWKMMLHVFQKTPHDLFTWGLRMKNPMSAEAEDTVRELGELLPHTMWDGRLEVLRFVLQKAIALRVQGHLEPLGPLSHARATGLIEKHKQRQRRAGSSSSRMQTSLSEEALHECRDAYENAEGLLPTVIEALESQVAGQSTQARSPEEQLHFYISRQDVLNVRNTLDSLVSSSSRFWSYKVRQYFKGYIAQTERVWKTLPPQGTSQAREWDQYSAIARAGDRLAGEPDMPLKDRFVHKRMAFWEAPGCDGRIQQLLFPSAQILERGRRGREIPETPVASPRSRALSRKQGKLRVERAPSLSPDEDGDDSLFGLQDAFDTSPSPLTKEVGIRQASDPLPAEYDGLSTQGQDQAMPNRDPTDPSQELRAETNREPIMNGMALNKRPVESRKPPQKERGAQSGRGTGSNAVPTGLQQRHLGHFIWLIDLPSQFLSEEDVEMDSSEFDLRSLTMGTPFEGTREDTEDESISLIA